MPIINDVIKALQSCVADRQGPLFETYSDFHDRYGFPGLPNSWANRNVLDEAVRWFKANNLLDLTFLLHSKGTGYPCVIDGLDSKKPTPKQMTRARQEAQKIINQYRPGNTNPY